MKKSICIILAAMGLFSACSEEEVITFPNDISGIFFQRLSSSTAEGVPYEYVDSLKYSFADALESVVQSTHKVPVVITGKAVNYDRKIRVVIEEETTTAILDKHYKVNVDTIFVKANTCRCYVPVTLLRTPDMLKNTFQITLKLEDNESFKILVNEYKNLHNWQATGTNLDATRYKIIVDEKYIKPEKWETMTTFGAFSAAKYLLVNELMGWTGDDWKKANTAGSKIGTGKAPYAALQMQRELQKRADNNDPLKDEDGNFVQLPEPYTVDYSKYE